MDEAVLRHGGRIRLEVLVHHQFLEREQPQVDVVGDPPARFCARHGQLVDARLRLEEQRLERSALAARQFGEREIVLASQQLGEGRVDHRFVVANGEGEWRSRRLAPQRHRQQYQRRLEDLVRRFGLRVLEQAQRQEERVDALLLERESRLLLDAPQRSIERLGLQARLQHRVHVHAGQRVRRVGLERAPVGRMLGVVERILGLARVWRTGGCVRLRARGRRWRRLGRGGERQRPLLVVEQAIDLGRLLVDHRDRGDLQGPEVQGPVASRQVEQLPLPGVERCVDDRLHQVGSGHEGSLGECREMPGMPGMPECRDRLKRLRRRQGTGTMLLEIQGQASRAAAVLAACSMFVMGCSPRQSPDGSGHDAAAVSTALARVDPRKVDELIASKMKRHAIPGMSIAIVQGGVLVHSRSYGMADVEHAVPVTPRSPFKIASLTKPITAMAILQLAERGRRVPGPAGRPVSRRICRIDGAATTIRQLLGHTSGLPDYLRAPGVVVAALVASRSEP